MKRSPRVAGWRLLPAGGPRSVAPPSPFPLDVDAHDRYLRLWSTPAAETWTVDDAADVASVALWQSLTSDALRSGDAGRISDAYDLDAGRMEIEDRLGLSPRARIERRWLVVADDVFDAGVGVLEAVESGLGRIASALDDDSEPPDD